VFFTRNPKKLGLHFPEFSTISMDFTIISKVTLLFEIRFCRHAPGKVFLLQIGPYFAQTTLETIGASQCGPWGGWPAQPTRFRGVPAAGSAGSGRRMTCGPPRLGFWPELMPMSDRRQCSPRSGGGGRQELGSSEVAARWET
jgi:hypothetical protein